MMAEERVVYLKEAINATMSGEAMPLLTEPSHWYQGALSKATAFVLSTLIVRIRQLGITPTF
jgi:hypothetical protein